MKRIHLIILAITIFYSCQQKANNQQNTGDAEIVSTEEAAIVDKHKDERLYIGMFSYVAQTGEMAFTECNQEFSISVVPLNDSDFISLFDAYKIVQADNILDYAYVEFKGYITDQKVSSETDDMRTIRISEFLKLDKNKSCD